MAHDEAFQARYKQYKQLKGQLHHARFAMEALRKEEISARAQEAGTYLTGEEWSEPLLVPNQLSLGAGI